MKILIFIFTASLAVVLLGILNSSSLAQEIQVHFDEEGEILVVDAKLRSELGLFDEYDGFIEAHLYQVFDSSYILEIIFKIDSGSAREQINMTEDEVFALRQNISKKINEMNPRSALDQSGRTRLLANSCALSLGYYGWSIPAMMEIHDGRTAVGMYILTYGLSFYIPYLMTENIPVTDGAAELHIHGSRMGILHGIHLDLLAKDNNADFRDILLLGNVVSVSEGILLYQYAIKNNLSGGQCAMMTASSNTLLSWSYGINYALGAWESEENNRIVSASALAGSAIGLVAGRNLGKTDEYSRGDVKVMQTMQMMGAVIPGAIGVNLFKEKHRAHAAMAVLGSMYATRFAFKKIEDKEFTINQGWTVHLSPFAGGLFGLGVHEISVRNPSTESVVNSIAIGATLGFFLIYNLEAPSATIAHNEKKDDADNNISWNMQFLPEGIMSYMVNRESKYEPRYNLPMLMFTVNF